MGEATYNILVKFEQQKRINKSFQGGQMLDAVNINHFSVDVGAPLYFLDE